MSDPSVSPRASWALAEALLGEGETEASTAEFSRAVAITDIRFAPHVALSLASRYAALGLIDASIEAYQRFLEEASPEDRELLAVAAYRLAELYVEVGKPLALSVRLLRKAIRDGSQPLRAHAMSTLADLLISEHGAADSVDASQRRGTQETAETLYQRVIAIDHADLAPRAAYLLGELRRRSGDRIGAEEMLQAAFLSEHPIYAPLAEKALEEAGEFDASDAVEDLLVQIFNAREQLSFSRHEREGQSITSSSLDAAVAWHRHRVCSGGMCAMGTFEIAEANALVLASIRRLLAVRLPLIERQPLQDRLLVSVRTSECSLKVKGHRDSPSALPVIYQQPALGTASCHYDVATPTDVVAPAAISSGLFVRERCEYIFTPRFDTCADPTS